MARKRTIPKSVEAEQFILRDAEGRARARLYMQDDSPAFELMDTEELPRITIQSGPDDRAFIRMVTTTGATSFASASQDGTVGLSLYRKGGVRLFDFGSSQGEELRFVVYGANGRPVVWQTFNFKPPSNSATPEEPPASSR